MTEAGLSKPEQPWPGLCPAYLFDGTDRLLAVQAQEFAAARCAIGVRAPGSSVCDVLQAIDGAQIVRSWPMRGPHHCLPAVDLAWTLGLTARGCCPE
ncbi:hypothetical protein E3O19_09460 [Cryobacterium algoritolerans]|uniref:Uncharacterized protein n=1 Tax=Cryobacterium algoritolerans TaxID=1259184 RepID=A0A4R8WSS9_9MICO|nr:hypothetical protein E3O19_09460 [Cryobacterium algoritolerans]